VDPTGTTSDLRHPAENAVQRWLHRGLGGLAALLLFFMMLLTFVDVVGRYLFNTPVTGGFEMTEVALATLIFAGLPLVTARDEHVTVDLFDRLIPAPVRHLRDAVISALCGGMLFVLSYHVWQKAGDSMRYGDVTAILEIPLGPMVYFMSVMLAATGLVYLWLAREQLRRDR
jgi:TRAP-type C4-dicarboxylate transport system permease small subunit